MMSFRGNLFGRFSGTSLALLFCLFVSLSFPAVATRAAVPEGLVERFQAHVVYLASEKLEGRGVGSGGIDLAAQYIAHHFKAAGLTPVGDDGTYFQSFEMTLHRTLTDETRLAIDGAEEPLRPREDFIPFNFSSDDEFSAPAVFCGYGIDAPDKHKHHDDFANLDLKGKVAMIVRGEPASWADADGTPLPHAMLRNKVYNARDRQAVAVLIVNEAPSEGEVDKLTEFEPHGADAYGIPAFHITRSKADAMLRRGGLEPLEKLEKQMRAGRTVSAELREVRVAGRAAFKTHEATTKNVLGLLRGEGPLAEQCVVGGAHYDHLGIRKPMMRRFKAGKLVADAVEPQIHNGADDNASGTAGLIEIARMLAAGPKPARSVLFIAFTAEESGLHGSRFYIENPVCTVENTVAMLNMDMIGRMDADKNTVRVFGVGTGTGLDEIVQRHASDVGLAVLVSPDGGGRSDHAVFVRREIPALHFFSGHHSDYHVPSDTAEKINADGGARITTLVYQIARELADRQERPAFQTVAVAAHPQPREGATNYRVVMGLAPGYGEDGQRGMAVEAVSPEGPAALAGMKPGDRIIRIQGRKVANIYDYMAATRNNKPGDTVEVVVLREGREVALSVTLAAAR